MIKTHEINHVTVCVLLRLYLARGEKPYKNTHPCYWHPWLVHVQMLKALMEQPAHTKPQR